MKRQLFLGAGLCLALSMLNANAQGAYPCPTVKFVSPYPPGGTTDILARMLAPGLAKQLGTNVIVENKGGASSNIGTEYVANSASDGCTLLLGNNTGVVINQNLYKLKINPSKDLAAVAEIASVPLVLYVNSAVPANNVGELIELIKNNPGKYSYASGGSGSPQHLMGEMLKVEKQLDLTHIPYRGQGPAMADVLAGQVPIAFETTTTIAAQISSGRIRVLATTGAVRPKNFPNVPTMKELGFNSFVIENWYGVFVAAKTPSVLIARLNKAINAVMKEPEVSASLNKMGSSDVAGTPEQFTQFINKEIPYWESLVKRTGATVD
ncbi:tripartite tricarboxylate transporter substrate binding protein [Polynucleobacter sp. AP-Titi-500A-B4]|uniref:Bug family tripartite tricarboxylate transporter substrate binding protein n=1 Tax=Polynucleobacter sp. AP-Titi-500A-B4 TaxID=2576923 RepID=UPI001BFED381|nr:tripartite tricarboxylate transporter substrate binding protein [Polynucleobacter sp. AP-Titi-500A-B4]QWE13258.1 tripartite tricarboxylate transporter substrate binding protein [Polynucleobacter sp. AP-Titi-500A-B4]